MELAKINAIKRFEEKKTMLDLGSVVRGVSDKEMRVARLSLRKTISQYEMQGEDGLPVRIKMITAGICRDYAIRSVTDQETFRFLDILRKYYSEMTVEEVVTAFELALVGELDEYLPKDRNGAPDRNSYQSFSLEFITKIIGAYKSFKGKIWVKVYKCSEKEEKPVTDEEKRQIFEDLKQTIDLIYLDFVESGVLSLMAPAYVADFLVKNNLSLGKDLNKSHFAKAREIVLLNEKNLEKRARAFNGEDLEDKALEVCAREIIMETFEKLKDEKRNSIWN
jgi:hypothetical protein